MLPTDPRQLTLFFVLIIGTLPFFKNMVVKMVHHEFGIDLIAVVGILSSLLMGEYLAGCVILLMLSGGEALELYATKRARKELTLLLARAPTIAHRKVTGGLEDISADDVKIDDIILVKQGETIPVDGLVLDGRTNVDESALTGESIPVEKSSHSHVMSGTITLDGAITVRALKASRESRYDQIIQLVREAENQKAPFVRLADRYSVWFTAIAFFLAGSAWLLSHDPTRALAVLVVATPCPLILAAPIAFSSGISRAAKRGIIIKFGGVMEKLAIAKTIVVDKTGTLTLGKPTVASVRALANYKDDKVVTIAASLDQFSVHILAKSLTTYARDLKLPLQYPKKFTEHIGSGVTGEISGKTYLFGKKSFLTEQKVTFSESLQHDHEENSQEGRMCVYLAEGKNIIGVITFADVVRPDIIPLFADLMVHVPHISMLTGDKRAVAERIANEVGIKEFQAECLPEDKLREVQRMAIKNGPVVMIGDGINDAPALAAADVGITIGNATAAAQAGDVVITGDSFAKVVEVFAISRRVLHIARECIIIGIGLSIVLMLFAATGFIKPVVGALLQEIIDIIVILNALRVHRTS